MARPRLERTRQAGERLRQALQVWQKSYGNSTEHSSHVCNWEKWRACGLPVSPSTVRQDVEQGVPYTRLPMYAECFGIPMEFWTEEERGNESRFKEKALEARQCELGISIALPFGASRDAQAQLVKYNSKELLQPVFEAFKGIFLFYYTFEGVDDAILFGCSRQEKMEENACIRSAGVIKFLGNMIPLDVHLMRWHNNVHMFHISQDGYEYGHGMSIDPSRHQCIAIRDPFYLHFRGITDDGMAYNRPINTKYFCIRVEDVEENFDKAWDQCYALVEKYAPIPSTSPYFHQIREIIDTEDITSAEQLSPEVYDLLSGKKGF